MAKITSTHSSAYHDVESKIYRAVMKLSDPNWAEDWTMGNAAGYKQAAKVASEMVKVFSKIHESYVNEQIDRAALVEWLLRIDTLTPIEISEIVQEMDENKSLMFDKATQKIIRGTGE